MLADSIKHLQMHHEDADGYIALAKKENGAFRQRLYKPKEIEQQLSEWIGDDVYFSQNTFYKPARRVDTVRQLRALYVDIDCHLFNYAPEWVLGRLELDLFKTKIPEPNIVTFSGRGLNCVWFIEPAPYKALSLWQAVQDYITNQFKEMNIGTDQKATDAARVFRIAGSINSKSGETVLVQQRHNYRYTLREIQADYLPELTPKKDRNGRTKKGRTSKKAHIYNTYTLHHARMMDIAKLVELRAGDVKGLRENICFLYRYWACCFVGDPKEALRQTLELNAEFKPPLHEREVITATRSAETAFSKREDAKSMGTYGEGYNYSNEKLIELLEISEDEQRHLSTIFGPTEKKRRKRLANEQMRREAGDATRSEYLQAEQQKSDSRLEELRRLIEENPKATQRELAALMGLSQSRVRDLYKLIKS